MALLQPCLTCCYELEVSVGLIDPGSPLWTSTRHLKRCVVGFASLQMAAFDYSTLSDFDFGQNAESCSPVSAVAFWGPEGTRTRWQVGMKLDKFPSPIVWVELRLQDILGAVDKALCLLGPARPASHILLLFYVPTPLPASSLSHRSTLGPSYLLFLSLESSFSLSQPS